MLRKLRIFVFVVFYINSNINVQGQFLGEYVVTWENDTIYGTVEFAGLWGSDDQKKVKLTDSEGNSSKYSPKEIKTFVNGASRYISLSKNSNYFYEEIRKGSVKLYKIKYKSMSPSLIPNSPSYIDFSESYIMEFPNGDRTLVDNSEFDPAQLKLTFPELTNYSNFNFPQQTVDLKLWLIEYNSYVKRTTFDSELNSQNDTSSVNILLFRRDMQIDDNQGKMQIRIDNKTIAELQSKEYLSLNLSDADWYQLEIRGSNLRAKKRFFGRRDNLILFEIAVGDGIYLSPIAEEKAKQYLSNHTKVEMKTPKVKWYEKQ